MSWKKNQLVYENFISNLAEFIGRLDIVIKDEDRLVEKIKTYVPEFVSDLRVNEVIKIHEYLMYMAEMKPDPRFPTYMYTGGDRIASVTRYLQKNVDLELAKQYA